jgi:tRNA 2-thiocytidine biosynthesis protein TtcA
MTKIVVNPPWTGIGRRIESMTRKALYDFEMIVDDAPVSVALSGGKDSIALLMMLKAISGKGFPKFSLIAIHVDGEFSCGAGVSQKYLQQVCDDLEVPLIVEYSTQKLETLECYNCSRERRRLLFDAAKKAGSTLVAFGHHRDDSVQTLLMNLLHKGEFAANLPKVPMTDYGVTILRPLIYVAEADIRTFAAQQGFMRITCQCPVGQVSLRRKTEDLVKLLEENFPNARENLARAGMNYGSKKALNP